MKEIVALNSLEEPKPYLVKTWNKYSMKPKTRLKNLWQTALILMFSIIWFGTQTTLNP
jgi:hypothetical protein